MKVWALYCMTPDAECEEWEILDTLYQEKPTFAQLETRFKFHQVKGDFVEKLLTKGEAYGGGYDNWHFVLREEECI